ncbi:patatin-like protein [Streptomyces sp. NPDC060065]|uniref:patatin-like protein n=1 Tax=Streptomyces sp. NPDC060065 TaxID=3347050 RepID=UPI0036BAD0EC
MNSPDSRAVTANTQDIRIACTMSGGVSLAVWMGGVSRELNLLQQAAWDREADAESGPDTPVKNLYRELLDLLDLTVSIDAMSGTSAGGINAALLGLTLANGLDLGPLRELWLKTGSLQDLLRDPVERHPPSLMQGDAFFYPQLINALDLLSPPRANAVRPLASEQREPFGVPVNVYIPTTLLSAESSRLTDAYGTQIEDANHCCLFSFDRTQLTRAKTRPALALAARASASFPLAFEPAFLPFRDGTAARGGIPPRPPMECFADITRPHWAADGGLLMNKPIGPLLRTVFDRGAHRATRRVLLYVVPTAGDEADLRTVPEAESPDAPPALSEALLRDLGAVFNQSISADVAALREHNERVRTTADTRLRLAELAGRLQDGDLTTDRTVLDYKRREGARLVRPVIDALMRELADTDPETLPRNWADDFKPGVNLEMRCRDAATDAVTARWTLPPLGDHRGLAYHGRPAYEGAKATVLAMIRAGYALAQNRGERIQLGGLATDVHRALTPLDPPDMRALVHGYLSPRPARSPEQLAAEAARDYASRLAGASDLADGWQQLASALHGARPFLETLAGEVARRTDVRGVRASQLLEAYLAILGPEPDDIARRLLDLHMTTRALVQAPEEAEQPVELIQVSSDTRTLLDLGRSTAKTKLTGLQFHHFGAFYKASWRANDWTWGRLDGAGWLVHVLLEPQRVLDCVNRDAPRSRDDRASWFGERLRLITGDTELPAEVAAELGFLDDRSVPVQLPVSLPETALWLARRWQREIAAEELPEVADRMIAEAAADRSPLPHDHADWAAAVRQAAAQADGAAGAATSAARTNRIADLLRTCPVPNDRLADEAGQPRFRRTLTRAGAVAAAALPGTRRPPRALERALAPLRTSTLAAYQLVRRSDGQPLPLALAALSLCGLGALALFANWEAVLGLGGVGALFTGLCLLVLLAYGWSPRLLLSLTGVVFFLAVVLPVFPFTRQWLFGTENCGSGDCAAHDVGVAGRAVIPWLRAPWWHIVLVIGGLLVVLVLLEVLLPRLVARLGRRRQTGVH